MGDYIKKTVLLDFLAMESIDWGLHMTKNKDLIDGATKAYEIVRKAILSEKLDADVENDCIKIKEEKERLEKRLQYIKDSIRYDAERH